MRAELKRLHSPDVNGALETFSPQDRTEFGILVQIMAGPEGEEAEESFDVRVCTPTWLLKRLGTEPLSGRYHLFVQRYDYTALAGFIAAYCHACTGETWSEVAARLGRLGRWEFEDYNVSKTRRGSDGRAEEP